jgi:hypothetical protein
LKSDIALDLEHVLQTFSFMVKAIFAFSIFFFCHDDDTKHNNNNNKTKTEKLNF